MKISQENALSGQIWPTLGCTSFHWCKKPRIPLSVLAIAALVFLKPLNAAADTGCGSNTGAVDCDNSGESTRSAGDPGSSGSPRQPSPMIGNPVNLITGNKYQNEKDLAIPGSQLTWQRHYNSANAAYNFGLGRGWTGTYQTSLASINAKGAAILQSNGRRIEFRAIADSTSADGETINSWHASTPSDGRLHVDGTYIVWSLPDGRSLRFKGQFLVRIDFPGSQFLTLLYNDKRLVKVSDQDNRTLQFDYYPDSQPLSR